MTSTVRKYTPWLGLVPWLALPSIADAHVITTGLGPFYDGVAHLLVAPEYLLPILAIALWAGLRGPRAGRLMLLALAGSWLLGSLLRTSLRLPSSGDTVVAATVLVLGLLVAANVKLPAGAVAASAFALGLFLGGFNDGEFVDARSATLESLGMISAGLVILSLVAGQVTVVRTDWVRIAVRVAGSWIAAIGMFMFGWSLRG